MMTHLKSHTLPLLLLFVFLTYMIIGFASNNLQPFTMSMVWVGSLFAGIQHIRGRWQFYKSPLPAMVLLWATAIGVSSIANPHVWRMSLESIWHVSLLVGVMAFFTGALNNKVLSRRTIEEAFLLLGLVIMAISYVQTAYFISQGQDIPRLGSLLGNPNPYAMFLNIVLMFTIHRIIYSQGLIVRLSMGLYLVVALVQLWLTGSNGGQISFVAAIVVYVGLWFITPTQPGKPSAYGRVNAALYTHTRIHLSWVVGILIIATIIASILVVSSPAFDTRASLYALATEIFQEKPLTGQGLYSFGERSMKLISVPPEIAHVNAHSIILNVLAELGILGGFALLYSIFAGIRAIVVNRRHLVGKSLRGYEASVAALVAISIHHLVDYTMMYMAMLVVILIVLVITPIEASPIKRPASRHLTAGALVLLTSALLLGAIWYIPINLRYAEILADYQSQTASDIDYVNLLSRLKSLIDQDPENRAYHVQYAMWAGELAYQTNTPTDITAAIRAHQDLLDLLPHYAVAWSNLAGLYWQANDVQGALEAAENGLIYAEHWPILQWQIAALSGKHYFPWRLHPSPYLSYTRTWLKGLYLRNIVGSLMLPQVSDSLTVPREDLGQIVISILHSTAAQVSQSMPPMEASE